MNGNLYGKYWYITHLTCENTDNWLFNFHNVMQWIFWVKEVWLQTLPPWLLLFLPQSEGSVPWSYTKPLWFSPYAIPTRFLINMISVITILNALVLLPWGVQVYNTLTKENVSWQRSIDEVIWGEVLLYMVLIFSFEFQMFIASIYEYKCFCNLHIYLESCDLVTLTSFI